MNDVREDISKSTCQDGYRWSSGWGLGIRIAVAAPWTGPRMFERESAAVSKSLI
jgi:hypothetical protein